MEPAAVEISLPGPEPAGFDNHPMISHLDALLEYSRNRPPAELAAALASSKTIDVFEIERLAAWASQLARAVKTRL